MRKLLTLDDLYKFYSNKKKSMKFSADKTGEPIVVQVEGKINFDKDETTEGLTAVTLQACHTEKNLNKSSISFETMQNKMLPTFKNRPILGYIHEVSGEPQFYGHNMHIDEESDEIIYDEIAVGIIPETNNAKLEYDEENDRYNVIIDGYIFDDYTKAVEILEREKECSVSVEIAIKEMSYSVKDKCLEIQDGYFSGITILGKDENGNEVKPGMAGSNIRLKDFSESNNSIFSEMTDEEHSKLIEILERLNNTLLSNFNIDNKQNISTKDYGKEENENVEDNRLLNEEVEGVEFTDETTENNDTTVTETESTEEVIETCEEETIEENPEMVDVEEEVVETEAKKKKCEAENDEAELVEETKDVTNFSKTFELSHDDIRGGLYELLIPYEEVDNDWYWIMEVFDDYFIYQGMSGVTYGQKYTVDKQNETVAFDGERYEVYLEYLTASEKAELEQMRSNYSSIQAELNTYKESELQAQREAVFNDKAYVEFIETDSFKKIKENINTYSVDELRTACDLAFAKEVKVKGTFALNTDKKDEKKTTNFFAFARNEEKSSFLDGLLKK